MHLPAILYCPLQSLSLTPRCSWSSDSDIVGNMYGRCVFWTLQAEFAIYLHHSCHHISCPWVLTQA